MRLFKIGVTFFLLLVLTIKTGYCQGQDNITKPTGAYLKDSVSLIKTLWQKIDELHIAGLEISHINFIQNGDYIPKPNDKALMGLPAFCLVSLIAKPSIGSYIKIEVWLPLQGWNGRLMGTGNGGGGGSISYGSLAGYLKQGFATANTDLGTSRGGANAAIGQPDVWADFGYRATHEMTVISKLVTEAFYGKKPHHSYFAGCSTGGQQALMEAQRFPDDYDGVLAGAPANNRTHLHTGFMHIYNAANKDGKTLFSNEILSLITRRIIQAYAGKDGGAPGDNFFTDPRLIHVNFDSLFKCGGKGSDTCLTEMQITALKNIYNGPVNLKTKEQIYTPPPVGSENVGGGLSYQQSAGGAASLFYQYKWVFGNDFDPAKFDFDKDQAKVDSMLGPLLNANNPDLSKFKKHGGRLIMYTGTADPLVPFQDALNYYERVVGRQKGLKQTQDFYRFFLVPGMGHCSGGPGLNEFGNDALKALINWVENNTPPEKLIATALNCCDVNGASRFKRPIFPYPKFPKYTGGDVNAEASYIGVEHVRNEVVKPAKRYEQ